jgi:hypothetical protein
MSNDTNNGVPSTRGIGMGDVFCVVLEAGGEPPEVIVRRNGKRVRVRLERERVKALARWLDREIPWAWVNGLGLIPNPDELFPPHRVTSSHVATLAARIAALEADLASVTRERDEAVRRNRCYRCDPDPDKCEHGVPLGDYCDPCNYAGDEAFIELQRAKAIAMIRKDAGLTAEDTPNDVKGGGK